MRGLAWYERLPPERRDWPRMNSYLAEPPRHRASLDMEDYEGVRSREGAEVGQISAFFNQRSR